MKKKILLALLALSGLLFAAFFLPFPEKRLNSNSVISLRLLDRNGVLLREVLSDEGGRCHWVELGNISPFLVQATIAAEDRYFFLHRGVHPLSMVRALWQNVRHGRVISGASTITQQLVRSLYPGRRNIWTKAREAWMAVRLERRLSKPDILTQYLNRISYGNQAFGIDAASRLYFDKPPAQLSLAESAFLAAIPRSPSLLNPYRAFSELKQKQAVILAGMKELGFISGAKHRRAMTEDLQLVPESMCFRAPHFCDFVLTRLSHDERRGLSAVETTLDYGLQEKIEALLKNYLGTMKNRGITNGAIIVLDNARGEIRGLVGSADFFDSAHQGQVNGVLAMRQPGSTLKPFTYGLALENGWTAASLIDDSPAQFSAIDGGYEPQNYDRRYHGMISLRAALACSYNIPAVALLQAIGPDLLYRRLHEMGFASLKKDPGYYGVGLTLGNGEVSLLELARAYSTLARQGLLVNEKAVSRLVRKDGLWTAPPEGGSDARPVFPPQVAYIITHILSDQDARIPSFGYHTPLSFPFPVAAKTGTSKDFRDNWTVGYSPDWTVGVWVGNFDGEPMHNVSGISGCGPLFKDVMLLLQSKTEVREFSRPHGITVVPVCPFSGELPTADCPGTVDEVFIDGTEPRQSCSYHRRPAETLRAGDIMRSAKESSAFKILFPQGGDVFKIDPVLRQDHQRIKLRIDSTSVQGAGKVEWWINGDRVGEVEAPFNFFWNLRPGSYTIKAVAVRDGLRLESRPVKITVLT
jgi:penicillin-binding protein 1C